MDTVAGLMRSKTFWFNFLTLLSMVAIGDDIKQFMTEATIIKVQAAVNIALRFFTSQALSAK